MSNLEEDDNLRYDTLHVKEQVDDPRPVDVLCGRGGMSNHHPGNEWYRRLIRSNRPLYRACPKHTKLLVAKAIVQAVEQQNGRFLERDKGSVHWFTISYKRAVDKTSQGLREKDRELDGTDDARQEVWKKRENDSGLTGRLSKAPTLADMTKGVIVRAESAQLSARRKPGRVKGSSSSKHKQSQPNVEQVKRTANTTMVPNRPWLEPGKGEFNPKSLPAQKLGATAGAAPVTAFQRTSTTDSLTPLPPTIQVRQSSIYRNLQGTSLLPASNAKVLKSQHGKQQQPRLVLPTNQTPIAPNGMVTPHAYARAPAPSKTLAPLIVPYGTPAQWGLPGANLQQAPELSRFTSQVSDWLNSFWPTAENGSSKTAGKHVPPRTAPPLVTLEEQPSDEAIAAVAGRPLPKRKSPVEEAEQDSKPAATMDAVQPERKFNKRKSLTMPPLPYAGVPDHTTTPCHNNETARHSLLTSELEQSVSATLLQLASSPTKLFSGLTSYFADDLDSEVARQEKKQRTDDDDDDNDNRRQRKRESLLEDYEETPMEARLRLVQY